MRRTAAFLATATLISALRVPATPPSDVQSASRRGLVASTAAPFLAGVFQPIQPALAAFGLGGSGVQSQVVSSPDICQGRCQDQDFVVIRYIGRRLDSTTPFDSRYAKRPLVYELGSFYLPGVDESIEGACVGSKLKLSWARCPDLGPEYAALLPPGTPIEMDVELLSIKYSLFGEKMRNASSTYWFAEAPLTLTSQVDDRGFVDRGRGVEIKKDNPFSIAPGEKSLISNPSSSLTNLFTGFFEFKLPDLPF